MKIGRQTVLGMTMLLAAVTPRPAPRGVDSIDGARLRADVEFLADDERSGRWLGEPGLAAAEEYISRAFADLDLVPLRGEADYFVDFTLYGRHYDPDSTRLTLTLETAGSKAEVVSADLGVDFRPFEFSALGAVEGEVVFAGYGITAPELGWDDYAGLDVEGKIVLVLRHEPGEDDTRSSRSLAGGTEHALFATKAENASRHGARGLLLVTDPLHHDAADDLRLQAGLSLEPSGARVARGSLPARFLDLVAMQISRPLAARLAASAGLVDPGPLGLATLQREVDGGRKPATIPLAARARLGVTLKSAADPVPGRNVLAMLRGRDPRLRDEWIVIGAHHDHVGSFNGDGDTVFNGADDNASGTAGVLALARAFATASSPPRRSLLFVTFSAEERGLLGSRALVESGKLPLENIRLMLNLDMIGRNPRRPLEVYGDGYALGLREIVEAANESVGLELSFAGTRYVSNSDHHPFFNEDIPVLFFFTGLHPDYHQVTDHADRLDYQHMEQIVRLAYGTLDRIANAETVPSFVHHVAWLGAQLAAEEHRFRVVETEPGSRARLLGLQTDDRLRSPDEGTSGRALARRVAELEPGDRLSLRLERQGGERALDLERPPAGFLGVRIAGVDEEEARQLGVAPGDGVTLEEVLPDSAAAAAGLRRGDVLLRVSGRRIDPGNLVNILEEIGAGVTVDLTVARDGRRLLVPVRLGKRP